MTEAAKKAPPISDAKVRDGDGYKVIGQEWLTSKKNVTSITLTEPAASFILVKRTPKAKTAQPS